MKNQLTGTVVSEEITKKLSRHRSRVSESVSDTGSSDKMNGSLQRQISTDSTDRSIRKRSSSADVDGKKAIVGEKLIEVEKTETGSVKWEVYKHYLKSIGVCLTIVTLALNMVFQSFSIGSNVWLSAWSTDKEIVVNGTTNAAKRDLYLGVYGALGIGQGKYFAIFYLFQETSMFFILFLFCIITACVISASTRKRMIWNAIIDMYTSFTFIVRN